MNCPRCEYILAEDPSECPRCGVVVARYRPPRPSPPLARSPSPPARSSSGLAVAVLTLISIAGIFTFMFLRRQDREAASAGPERLATSEPTPASDEPEIPVSLPTAESEWVPDGPPPDLSVPNLDLQDASTAARLATGLRAGRVDVPADLADVEALLGRHRSQPEVHRLVEAVFLRAAELNRGPSASGALPILERAVEALPTSFVLLLALAQVQTETGLWPSAETSAQAALSLRPKAHDALLLLGFILMRQDRDREAKEALEASLALHDDPRARALLEQVKHSMDTQRGMTEQRLSHFNVRYDGEAHESMGREVLRVLERHYVTLVQAFSHELRTVVPVILYTNRGYYDATGAPAWSGGQYSHLDGRVSLPIGGVGSQLPADAERALLHELAHAFIHDMGGAAVPREIHEGMAQWMEGERCEGGRFSAQDLQAVAAGRRNDVAAFYIASLCFVEHLHRERGQGGLNDFLASLRETSDVERSFGRVYGRTFSASVSTWRNAMRRQHGG